jgi:hypothetical protein
MSWRFDDGGRERKENSKKGRRKWLIHAWKVSELKKEFTEDAQRISIYCSSTAGTTVKNFVGAWKPNERDERNAHSVSVEIVKSQVL